LLIDTTAELTSLALQRGLSPWPPPLPYSLLLPTGAY
jgi:hypothetical protein